jgi:hypothetical protein
VNPWKAFRQECSFAEAIGSTGYLELTIKAPEVKHKIFLKELQAWMQQSGGSPG